ncbi:putative MFS glucose transporter [Tuber magnatum]|uniref:Putative MFS glucose transporter n=1 Tax=Tuber magnatum TaxID=42249 RepID=A0A317STF4_9PEZI|nr:putative MFS glucose transporter [Tuber magnatum]
MYRISNIYVLAAFGTIGGALFGFDISSMSAWIGAPQYLEYFNSPNSDLQGGITASMSAGSFAGAVCAGYLSDILGRKHALLVASVIWVIGSVVTLSAQNVAHLVAGRVVNGLTVGVMSSQVPVYLAELSPKNIRGRIVGIQQWAIEWGILIMYMISYGCTFIDGPASFRTAWGIQAIPALFLIAALFFFPESPRWYASKDRWDEALDVLALLHGKGNIHDPLVRAEFEEVREAQALAAIGSQLSILGLFGPSMWRRTVCGLFCQIWQQLLGGNVMMYYIVYVFNMAGLTGNVNLVSSSIQYVIFLITTAITLLSIDRLGRRPLFLYGGIAMGALNFAVAGLMKTGGHHVEEVGGNANIKWRVHGSYATGVIACSYIFVAFYGLTWAPAAWVFISEIFPLQWRAKGVGLSAAANWLFNFALAYFVPPAFRNIQWRTYIIFGVFCFCGVLHSYLMFPETAGKTLEEIDYLFNSKVPAWKSSKVKSRLEERVGKFKGQAEHREVEVTDDVEKGNSNVII